MSNVPESFEPLDQQAVARIIRRAVELDSNTVAAPDHAMSVDALVEAAGEVGVSPQAVRHAVALERLSQSTPAVPGRVDRVVGPAQVVIERRVPMAADQLLERIERELGARHQLRRVERRTGGSTWERRRDVAAAIMLALRRLVGEGGLGAAHRIGVAVEQLPHRGDAAQPIETAVRISVDRTSNRTGALIGGVAVGAAGTGAAAVGAVLVAPVAAGLVVPGMAAGAAITWYSRRQARAVETELRVLLDQVLHDEPLSLSSRVVRRLLPGNS